MRRAACVAAAAMLGAAFADAAAPLHAQSGCTARRVAGSEWTFTNAGTPNEIILITGGAHIECDGDRLILAELATIIRAAERIELFRNVQVQDPERTLTADQATFFSEREMLNAIGNVVVLDRATGSTISSEMLDYYQETAERPEARLEANSPTGAARAVLFRAPGTAPEPASDTVPVLVIPADAAGAAGAATDSTIVEATRITIVGEQTFHAERNAVMIRDSMRATGHTITYSQAEGQGTGSLEVAQNARVEMPSQVLSGDSISALLGADDELREVLTRHDALLAGDEMQVTAPAIRLFFANGGVERMVAMGWQGAEPGPRPTVQAESYMFESDSIDILAPDQQLAEAIAIGDAYGERLTPDSLRALLPELPPEQMALVSSDWMRGDTVRASFASNPAAAGDPDVPATIMERLMANGSPALSLYRMRDENSPDAMLSINYLSASRIEVAFADGTVSVVTAAGDAKGTYLQPQAGQTVTGEGGVRLPANPPMGTQR